MSQKMCLYKLLLSNQLNRSAFPASLPSLNSQDKNVKIRRQ